MGVPCSTHTNRSVPGGDSDDSNTGSASTADDSSSTATSSEPTASQSASCAPHTVDAHEGSRDGGVGEIHRDGGQQNAMAVVANAVSLRQERRHLRQQQRDREEKLRAQRRRDDNTNNDAADGEVRDAALYQAMLQQALERARVHQQLRQEREERAATAVLAVPRTATGATQNETERGGNENATSSDDGPLGKCTKVTKSELHSSTDDGGGGNPSSTTATSAAATNPNPNPSSHDMVALAGLASAEPGTSTSSGEPPSPVSDVSPPPFANNGPRRSLPWGDADERRSRTPYDSGYAAGAGSSSSPSDHPRNAERPNGADAFGAPSDTVTSSRDQPSGRLGKSLASTSSYA